MRASMSPSEKRGGGSPAKQGAALLLFSSSAVAYPGSIAFVHCMRSRPARSARHSAMSVSACGSGPGRREWHAASGRKVKSSPASRATQGCWDPMHGVPSSPIQSHPGQSHRRGVCHGAWLLSQFPGCSGACRAGGAEEATLRRSL